MNPVRKSTFFRTFNIPIFSTVKNTQSFYTLEYDFSINVQNIQHGFLIPTAASKEFENGYAFPENNNNAMYTKNTLFLTRRKLKF